MLALFAIAHSVYPFSFDQTVSHPPQPAFLLSTPASPPITFSLPPPSCPQFPLVCALARCTRHFHPVPPHNLIHRLPPLSLLLPVFPITDTADTLPLDQTLSQLSFGFLSGSHLVLFWFFANTS
mmetsp:Transcript_8912/g.15321  ORF Transcript_8912/g.15321 Transcript_8912/m.15321 type:complete len:124 (-) Transcript_8912:103-474(-)